MKKKLIITALIISTILFKLVFAGSLEAIKPLDAKNMFEEKKAVIVDVREADEVKEGKVKGSIVIAKSLMDNNKEAWSHEIEKLPKDKTIILYCRSGRRAELVGTELSKKGFKVLNMGGFDSWKSQNLQVE
jgi:phage shock protein E